jgi:hypothetical protein
MILRRVDRLAPGMRVVDAEGTVWGIDKIWRDGERISISFYDYSETETKPDRGQALFPDDLVQIIQ